MITISVLQGCSLYSSFDSLVLFGTGQQQGWLARQRAVWLAGLSAPTSLKRYYSEAQREDSRDVVKGASCSC